MTCAWQISISRLSGGKKNKLAHWFEQTREVVMVTTVCGKLVNPCFAEPAGTDASRCGDCVRKLTK